MMRRIWIGIVTLLLLQSSLFIVLGYGERSDGGPVATQMAGVLSSSDEVLSGTISSRDISPEGVWLDELESDDHMEMMNNITLENGSARTSYNAAVPHEDTIGLWHLDGPGGNLAVDSGPQNNHGTVHGSNQSVGIMGNCISFDGRYDHVDLGRKTSHNVTEAISMEAWMKVEPDSWKYRRHITIDGTKVMGTLVDFPVLVSIDGESMKDSGHGGPVRPGGGDIRFTDEQGGKLNHEIEHYDGSRGKLAAWVRLPVLSSGADTKIQLHYGNPDCDDQQSARDVWGPDFSFVHHLSETQGIHFDSTANGIHGTPHGGVLQDSPGRIDGADGFDGVDDRIDCGEMRPPPEGTISLWVNVEKVTNGKDVMAGGSDDFEIKAIDEDDGYKVTNDLWVGGGNVAMSSSILEFNSWYHVACAYDNSGRRTVYVNGLLDGARTGPYDDPGSLDLFIGARGDYRRYLAGMIDEFRLSQVVRNASWINTSYENQADPDSFLSIGAEELSGLHNAHDSWLFKRPVTIEPPTSLEDQQIRIELGTSGFDHARCRPGGKDIRFLDGDMRTLPHWIERWNEGGTSVIWVRVHEPGTSSMSMYYGNRAAGSASNASAVFDLHDDFPENFPRFFGTEYPGWKVKEGSWMIEGGVLKNYWGPDIMVENGPAPMVPGRALRTSLMETAYWKHPQIITAWQDADNYYFVDLSGGNHRLKLAKKVGGVVSVLMEAERPEVDINRWFQCELAWVSHTKIKVVLWDMEGNPLISLSSSVSEGWSSGPFGLAGASGVSKTWFDSVAIRKVVEVEPAVTLGSETALGLSKAGAYSLGRNATHAVGTIRNSTIIAPVHMSWNHVAQTYDGILQRLYVDGELEAEQEIPGEISANPHRLLMGDMWKGGLDEVVLHDRALSADEVAARSRTYLPKGIMRSEIIRLPDVMLWDDLGYRCSLPEGTHIEISVHDGNTGELMFTHTASEPGEAVDLTSVNPLLYRSLFLSASFSSGQTATPILHNWSVSWKAPSAPEVLKEGGPITILEDTLSVGILDLGEYFHDRHTDLGAPGYGLSYISGRDRVGLNVSGSLVGVDWMVDNWTGTVLFSAACTNVFNLTSPPVDFELMVTNVNDAPVLTGISPEDGSTVAEREQTLHWKVLDVDNSSDEVTCDLYFGSTVPPPLVGRGLTAEHWDTGELDDGITYYWNLSCSDGLSTVEPVSGAWSFTVDTSVNVPKTILIAPMNGSVINTTTVNLGWDVKGTGDNSTKFHIFLGAGNSSLSRLAVVNGSTYTLEDLPDNTEYRWKVVPVSGSLEGVCASGTWTFRIDTKGEPYEPEGQMFKMWLEPSYITMLAGDAEEVNVLLYSYAEAALPVRLKVSGILSEYAHIEENIVLEHGWRNITLNLSPPADVETGLYKLNVNISYGNVTLGETLFAYVEGNGTGGDIGGTEDPDPGGPGINWFCIIPFIILVIMVVVIAVYIRIGKEPTEEYAEPRRVMEYGRRPARGIPPHPVGVVSAPPERRVAPVMAERAFPESSPAPTSRQQASPAEEGKEEKEMEKGMKEEERKATGEWELDLSEGEPEMKNVESIVISEPRAHRMPVKTSADDLLEDIGSELARRYREENSKDGGAPDPNGPDLNELDLAGLDLD